MNTGVSWKRSQLPWSSSRVARVQSFQPGEETADSLGKSCLWIGYAPIQSQHMYPLSSLMLAVRRQRVPRDDDVICATPICAARNSPTATLALLQSRRRRSAILFSCLPLGVIRLQGLTRRCRARLGQLCTPVQCKNGVEGRIALLSPASKPKLRFIPRNWFGSHSGSTGRKHKRSEAMNSREAGTKYHATAWKQCAQKHQFSCTLTTLTKHESARSRRSTYRFREGYTSLMQAM